MLLEALVRFQIILVKSCVGYSERLPAILSAVRSNSNIASTCHYGTVSFKYVTWHMVVSARHAPTSQIQNAPVRTLEQALCQMVSYLVG